jgi:hypothetical protein
MKRQRSSACLPPVPKANTNIIDELLSSANGMNGHDTSGTSPSNGLVNLSFHRLMLQLCNTSPSYWSSLANWIDELVSTSALPPSSDTMNNDVAAATTRLRSLATFRLLDELPDALVCHALSYLNYDSYIYVLPFISKRISRLLSSVPRSFHFKERRKTKNHIILQHMTSSWSLIRSLRIASMAIEPLMEKIAVGTIKLPNLNRLMIEWNDNLMDDLLPYIIKLLKLVPSLHQFDMYTGHAGQRPSVTNPKRIVGGWHLITGTPCPVLLEDYLLNEYTDPYVSWCGLLPHRCSDNNCGRLCYPSFVCQPEQGCTVKPTPLLHHRANGDKEVGSGNDGAISSQLCRTCLPATIYKSCDDCGRRYHANDLCSRDLLPLGMAPSNQLITIDTSTTTSVTNPTGTLDSTNNNITSSSSAGSKGDEKREETAPTVTTIVMEEGKANAATGGAITTAENKEAERKVNDSVEAKWRDTEQYFMARIVAINNDGTYHLAYSDGDVDHSVPLHNIQVRHSPHPLSKLSMMRFWLL